MSDAAIGICCVDVHKSYPLYAGTLEMALDRFGLGQLARLRRGGPIPQFPALRGINLTVHKGERVGIVGRNGAGKTTLLKLLTGNFQPTSGHIDVDGKVQTLMNTGLGFHPEFTGYENLKSALQYNDLTKGEYQQALADAIEFIELGDFLHQPVSTYSLGMRTRLQFAAATAIKPDILIVDEVLGAGDAYFGGKSSRRVKALTQSGCTLLLVSHSMQQVLQFCHRVVWIEAGQVVMEGDALPVVRAYEEYTRHLEHESASAHERGITNSVLTDEGLKARLLDSVRNKSVVPTEDAAELDTTNVPRWPGKDGARIVRLRLYGSGGKATRIIRPTECAVFEIDFEYARPEPASMRFVIVIYREDGQVATRLISDYTTVSSGTGTGCARVELPEAQFGAGTYIASAAIYERLDLGSSSDSIVFDLISRCFKFSVLAHVADDPSLFYLSQSWKVESSVR